MVLSLSHRRTKMAFLKFSKWGYNWPEILSNENLMTAYIGSEWRKWDLHVHTHISESKQLGTIDLFASKLLEAVKVHDISVIATADYFSLDGYEELIAKGYYNPKDKTLTHGENTVPLFIIPGVELRLDVLNGHDKSVNIHVFFDPSIYDLDKIWRNFLGKLKITGTNNKNPNDNKFLSRDKKDLAEIYDSYAKSLSIKDGCETEDDKSKELLNNITICWDSLKDAITSFKYPDIKRENDSPCFLALVAKGHGSIASLDWKTISDRETRSSGIKKDLITNSDFIFSNADDDIEFYLGNKDDVGDVMRDCYGGIKPCVWGCDASKLENLLHPSDGNTKMYTWIKGDLTFEALRQVKFEPDIRVYIGEHKPSEPVNRIIRFQIDMPSTVSTRTGKSFCLTGKHVFNFSPYLTCIIGGRGAGKSTLLNLLYEALANNPPHDDKRKDLIPALEQINAYTKVESTNSDIDFLGQNEIEKFAEDKDRFKRAILNRALKGKTRQEIEEQGNSLEESLEALESNIDFFIEKNNLRRELKELEKEELELSQIIKSYSDVAYTDMQKKLSEFTKELESRKRSKESLLSLDEQIHSLVNDYSESVIPQSEEIDELDALFGESNNDLAVKLNEYDEEKNRIISLLEGISIKEDFIDSSEEKNEEFLKKISELEESIKLFLIERGISEENQQDLAHASRKMANIKSQSSTIHQRIATLDVELKKFDTKKFSEVADKFLTIMEEALKILEENLSTSDSVKKIGLSLQYNFEQAKHDFIEFFLEKFKEDFFDRDERERIKNVLFEGENNFWDIEKQEEQIALLHGSGQTKDTIAEILESPENWEIFRLGKLYYKNNWNKYQYFELTYGSKSIDELSFGEKCTAVIVLMIQLGNSPLIIDEPEAHLDSHLIANELVQVIRSKKKDRQIIFATHNANFVINGDSELIHALVNQNGKTGIESSLSIENLEKRDLLLRLEGGRAAFKQREKKYQI